jgi:hypothetical protein
VSNVFSGVRRETGGWVVLGVKSQEVVHSI